MLQISRRVQIKISSKSYVLQNQNIESCNASIIKAYFVLGIAYGMNGIT